MNIKSIWIQIRRTLTNSLFAKIDNQPFSKAKTNANIEFAT